MGFVLEEFSKPCVQQACQQRKGHRLVIPNNFQRILSGFLPDMHNSRKENYHHNKTNNTNHSLAHINIRSRNNNNSSLALTIPRRKNPNSRYGTKPIIGNEEKVNDWK
jgi:hypothetical protein